MRVMIWSVLILALAASWVLPAAAQDGPESYAVTFRLVLYGDAPEGEKFQVGSVINNSDEGVAGGTLCGPRGNDRGEDVRCEGGGAVYTLGGTGGIIPEGSTFAFLFQRIGSDGELQEFAEGVVEDVSEDLVVTAYYEYRTGQGGLGEGPDAPALPDAGAGG